LPVFVGLFCSFPLVFLTSPPPARTTTRLLRVPRITHKPHKDTQGKPSYHTLFRPSSHALSLAFVMVVLP
jgi:hypothetical protein